MSCESEKEKRERETICLRVAIFVLSIVVPTKEKERERERESLESSLFRLSRNSWEPTFESRFSAQLHLFASFVLSFIFLLLVMGPFFSFSFIIYISFVCLTTRNKNAFDFFPPRRALDRVFCRCFRSKKSLFLPFREGEKERERESERASDVWDL